MVDARQLTMAFIIAVALHIGLGSDTSTLVGVSIGSSWTLALVTAGLVDADSSALAGIEEALVNVCAPCQGIASVTRLAETLWGIGGCALGVVTAAVTLARALTTVSVEIVHIEGR